MSSIVILTGAGISAESGIPTFRATDGLWHQHRIEDVATPEGFVANPSLVHEFYNARRRQLLGGDINPNAAHQALARLLTERADDVLLVTQNIDDLHDRAGGEVLHMHGELLKMRCAETGQLFDWREDVGIATQCQCCGIDGRLRPHVVWFGEQPLQLPEIYEALTGCDVFAAIGTSGHVYPAAGFAREARQSGAFTVEFNLDQSAVSDTFDEHRIGKASDTVPAWVDELLR